MLQYLLLIKRVIIVTYILAGIYSKLKGSTVVWDEKLSLAKNAWDSVDCVIPNKQKVLLDWTVQEILNGYKKGVQ